MATETRDALWDAAYKYFCDNAHRYPDGFFALSTPWRKTLYAEDSKALMEKLYAAWQEHSQDQPEEA